MTFTLTQEQLWVGAGDGVPWLGFGSMPDRFVAPPTALTIFVTLKPRTAAYSAPASGRVGDLHLRVSARTEIDDGNDEPGDQRQTDRELDGAGAFARPTKATDRADQSSSGDRAARADLDFANPFHMARPARPG